MLCTPSRLKQDKKDGYRQLNVRQLGIAYAPGTIAVNVTWIEREFNACQTPRSMYLSSIYLQPFLRYSGVSVQSDWFSYSARERMNVF